VEPRKCYQLEPPAFTPPPGLNTQSRGTTSNLTSHNLTLPHMLWLISPRESRHSAQRTGAPIHVFDILLFQ